MDVLMAWIVIMVSQMYLLSHVIMLRTFDIHSFLHVPGEGNGTPLQYSCLENHMDGGAWWATVRGAQSRP